MSHPFEEKFKDRSSKEKLILYHLYNGFVTYLNQTLTKEMEKYLYDNCKKEDNHCFIIEFKDGGKYLLVEDYFKPGGERISDELIFRFAEEYGLRVESVTHEVNEHFDDFSLEHYTSETNNYCICYELKIK